MKEPLIRTENLKHDFIRRDDEGEEIGRVHAVDGVSLEIEEGEFVAVLGRNGSGKSTLAKHLNALLFPTEGAVWVDGYDVNDEDHLLDIRKSAGMVFQNPDNQIVAGVVEEDVAFGPENIGVPTEEIWERVEKSLRSVGLSSCRKDSPSHLSGGQKQRVAIAGIVAMEPKCIIFDEATSMLDPAGRKEVLEAAEDLNREKNVTIILITHHMEEAVRADRIYVMDAGRAVMEGTPREIFSRGEEIREHGLELPQIAELAEELREDGVPLPRGILTREELVDAICRWKCST